MAVKTTGVEFKKFFQDDTVWVENAYMQDEEMTIDDVDIDLDYDLYSTPDTAIVTILAGIFVDEREETHPLEAVFRKWRKKQKTATFIVEADKDIADEVKAACRAAGGKILR